jgi:hypothetical protein
MPRLRYLLISLLLVLPVQVTQAEVISIVDPSFEASDVPRPTQGMSMTEVSTQFGEPDNKVAPVGEPPISRWEYKDFTVYFEHNLVIHSVPKREIP